MGLPPCHVNLSNLNQRPELLLAASWGELTKNGELPGLPAQTAPKVALWAVPERLNLPGAARTVPKGALQW